MVHSQAAQIVLIGLLLAFLAVPAEPRGGRSSGEGRGRRPGAERAHHPGTALPAAALRAPAWPHDIAIVPVSELPRQASGPAVEERLAAMVAAEGLRVAPRERVLAGLANGGSVSYEALGQQVGARYFLRCTVGQMASSRTLTAGGYLMSAAKLLVGGTLVKIKNTVLPNVHIAPAVAVGAAVLGLAAVGVTHEGRASVDLEVVDGTTGRSVWRGNGHGRRSRQFLALLASGDRLARQALDQALREALRPPAPSESLFPVRPWATLPPLPDEP